MATVADVLESAYDLLYPGNANRAGFTVLNQGGTLSSGASSFTVTDSGVVPNNSVVEIDAERIFTGTNSGTTVAARQRGWMQSAAASHADSSIVWIKPTYYRDEMFEAFQDVIGELINDPSIYSRVTDTATYSYSTLGYIALTAGWTDVKKVSVASGTGTSTTYKKLVKGKDYQVIREFSPIRLQLRGGAGRWPGSISSSALIITASKNFVVPTTEADDLNATLLLPTTLTPRKLAWGLAAQLLSAREVPRIQIEDIQRFLEAQQVQVGSQTSIAQVYQRRFWTYIDQEKSHLRSLDAGWQYAG